jgi:hypothetical protein
MPAWACATAAVQHVLVEAGKQATAVAHSTDHQCKKRESPLMAYWASEVAVAVAQVEAAAAAVEREDVCDCRCWRAQVTLLPTPQAPRTARAAQMALLTPQEAAGAHIPLLAPQQTL